MSNDDSKRLADLSVGDAKSILVYGTALVLALVLFFLLIGKVLVALLLGLIAGVYLIPVQEWLESHLRARAGSALVTIALIVLPLAGLVAYTWYELSGYSNLINERPDEIIDAISAALARYFPVERESTRIGLQAGFVEALTRSAEAVQGLRQRSALLLASTSIFFFTIFYVLTQRKRTVAYIKMRVPGVYLPLYEKLAENVGGALQGALRAVFIDQLVKAVVITVLNVVFGIPLKAVLFIVCFMIGFFPLLGEWAIYIPASIYLLVFRNDPTSALIYLLIGICLTITSSLLLRPRLASGGSQRFNFFWMFIALVAGVYTFGIPGIVLGPATIGLIKAVADTLLGDVRYSTSLLKSEAQQQASNADDESTEAVKNIENPLSIRS
ncbi:MAG: AI-2E family transporter [Pyrinomonadaceae bacterium]